MFILHLNLFQAEKTTPYSGMLLKFPVIISVEQKFKKSRLYLLKKILEESYFVFGKDFVWLVSQQVEM